MLNSRSSSPGISAVNHSPFANRIYRAGWILFILLFLLSGAVDHDPWWKRGEAYSFGIVYHFYVTHTWLIPINAGSPFMEKPPLYYWTSVVMCKLLGGLLPLHDAARFASIFYSVISAFFTWKAAKTLFSHRPDSDNLAAICLLLFLGNYGLVHYCHTMITDTALLAGTSITLYAMARICMFPESYKMSGIWLGLGLGIAFMSKGLVMPGILIVSAIILLTLLAPLRTRQTGYALGIALIVFSPFLLIWPYLVYQYSPALFTQWIWDNNIGRFFGFSVSGLGAANRPLYFLWLAPIFVFPTFLMACAEAVITRKQYKTPQYLLPLSIGLTGMVILLISASGRAPYLLPLMPAFSLLSAPLLLRIPSRALIIWNRFVMVLFSLAITATWIFWINLLLPAGKKPMEWLPAYFDKWIPADYVMSSAQPIAMCVAFIAGLFWIMIMSRERSDARSTARIWFVGAAALWCTTHTLLLPWINENRSYRPALTRLLDFVQHSDHPNDCIGNNHVGENIAPMMQYFTGKEVAMPMQDWDGDACPLLLVFADKTLADDVPPHWHIVWRGAHMRDMKNMELRLYERNLP